jgi:hypothetical protein
MLSNTETVSVTVTFARLEADDDSPDVSYLEQDCFNLASEGKENEGFDRIAAFKRGEWSMIGIRAKATIIIRRANYATHYELESPGLWGIESDSGEDYLKSVFDDECAILRADIEALKLAAVTDRS